MDLAGLLLHFSAAHHRHTNVELRKKRMLSIFSPVVRAAENAAERNDLQACLAELRKLPLSEFGTLFFSLPRSDYPAMSSLLPRMADQSVQKGWTGAVGDALLKGTVGLVNAGVYGYQAVTGEVLDGKRILDFGCGYGRMIRLMYKFTDVDSVYGCDPWDKSIQICKADGVLGNFEISDYLPERLPFTGQKFDYIYAHSVFTHTSERATKAALTAIRQAIAPRGALLITVRPIEFWAQLGGNNSNVQVVELEQAHERNGFAFYPHNRPPVDGDITYGDTSISLEYLKSNFPFWKIARVDVTLDSPFQIFVFMTPQ
jgi:SAM-dependent methyltransferase